MPRFHHQHLLLVNNNHYLNKTVGTSLRPPPLRSPLLQFLLPVKASYLAKRKSNTVTKMATS
jgi:hypothetical protein